MSIETRWITDKEAAGIMGVARQTMKNWRVQRKGPEYIKIYSLVRYNIKKIHEFMEGTSYDKKTKMEKVADIIEYAYSEGFEDCHSLIDPDEYIIENNIEKLYESSNSYDFVKKMKGEKNE